MAEEYHYSPASDGAGQEHVPDRTNSEYREEITDFTDEGLWREAGENTTVQCRRVIHALQDPSLFRPELKEAVIAVACCLPADAPEIAELDNAWKQSAKRRLGLYAVRG